MSCFTVTLAEADKTYRLSDLITDTDPDPDNSETLQQQARELIVSAHPDNTGKVFGGEDPKVTRLRAGYCLTPTSQPRIYQIEGLFTSTTTKYFVADQNNQQLLVELFND